MKLQVGEYTFKTVHPDEFIVEHKLIPIFDKYKEITVDDYWPTEKEASDKQFRDLIALCYPWFFACYDEKGNCGGYFYLCDWRNTYHSCALHLCIDEKYHGKPIIKSIRHLYKILMKDFNIFRIEGCLPVYNKKGIAFAKLCGATIEGIQRGASIKNGKPLDYVTYAKIQGDK